MGSRLGFIMAATGSAIGLGNSWEFPYMAGQKRWRGFFDYLSRAGLYHRFSVMLCEFVIGLVAERNPVGAYAALKGGPWKIAGYIGVGAGFITLSFYSAVSGWAIAYIFKSV